MSFSYYHQECPTCKNEELIMVEGVEAEMNKIRPNSLHVDKRYIAILPDVWGEEAKRIGGKLPFLYDTETRAWLHVDAEDETMKQQIKKFFCADCPKPEPQIS